MNIFLNRNGSMQIVDADGKELATYQMVSGALLYVSNGAAVSKGDALAVRDPHNMPIISEKSDLVKFKDMIPMG